jgi:hypothetical protein
MHVRLLQRFLYQQSDLEKESPKFLLLELQNVFAPSLLIVLHYLLADDPLVSIQTLKVEQFLNFLIISLS